MLQKDNFKTRFSKKKFERTKIDWAFLEHNESDVLWYQNPGRLLQKTQTEIDAIKIDTDIDTGNGRSISPKDYETFKQNSQKYQYLMLLKLYEDHFSEHGTDTDTFTRRVSAGDQNTRLLASVLSYYPGEATLIRAEMRYTDRQMRHPTTYEFAMQYLTFELNGNGLPAQGPIKQPLDRDAIPEFVRSFWPALDTELEQTVFPAALSTMSTEGMRPQ